MQSGILRTSLSRLNEEESEIKSKLSHDEQKRIQISGYSEKDSRRLRIKKVNHYPGLKNQLNEIKKQKEEINGLLLEESIDKKSRREMEKTQDRLCTD